MRLTTLLILPGLGGAGLSHWQTLWQLSEPGAMRIEPDDPHHPVLSEWIDALEDAVIFASSPVALVAHGLACTLVAHWARSGTTGRVAAAMLVAPSDVECQSRMPPETWDFAPIPRDPLPFPTAVVASADDSCVDIERAYGLARDWRARVIDIGRAGHINAKSGLGGWPEGRRLLTELLVSPPV
jgi:hypothetical protein